MKLNCFSLNTLKEESNLSRVLGTICYDEPFEVIAVFHRNMSLPFSVEDTVSLRIVVTRLLQPLKPFPMKKTEPTETTADATHRFQSFQLSQFGAD